MRTKKLRWKRWVLWSLVIIVVLGGAGLFAADYAVNKVIDSMANSMLDDIDQKPDVNVEPSKPAIDHQQSEDGRVAAAPDQTGALSEPIASKVAETSAQKQDTPKQTSENANQAASGDKQSGDADDQAATETDEIGKYAPDVSAKKAQAIKEKVTASEKAEVASILIGNLSVSDIKLFQELAGGGMSVEEKKKARAVLLDKLSPEEYNKLSKIAGKYGVSEGKTYDEIKEQEERAGLNSK